jgi:signal transduction histidine kinase
MKLYFRKRVVVGFILALTILATLGIYSYLSTQRLIDTARLLSHALRVINNAEQLLVVTVNLETGQRGYVITGDRSYLQPYDSALKHMPQHIETLLDATADDREQYAKIQTLKKLIERRAKYSSNVIAARNESFEKARAVMLIGDGKKLTDSIRAVIKEVQEKEKETFRKQNTITGNSLVQFQYSFVGLLVAPLIIVLVLFYSINTHLQARSLAEKQLRKASGEIQHLNKELEAYTYSVSHDLRAPLRSIDGYSQILKEDYAEKLDDEGRRVINVVINNARRMGQLIDDLLDFSRIGRKEIIKADFNIDTMVQDVVGELTEHKNGRKVDVKILPLKPIKADPNMLRQVWINLISNAIKYSSQKEETKIEIGSFHEDEATCFYVKDNGVGFNMDYKDKLFGVFQRLHKAEEFEGTGVGLALVKRIINRHGGQIWAEAKLNEGATFYFTLPN